MAATIPDRGAKHEERSEADGPVSRRQCAGCAKRDAADALVRVVLGEEVREGEGRELAVDFAGSRFGRGAHVHPAPSCVEKAFRGGFAKVFKTKVAATPANIEAFGEQLIASADRRIEGLIAGARRGKLVVSGADVVREAWRDGSAALVIVACDAGAAQKHSEVQDAIGQGKALAYGNKQRLGALFGRDEVAVCAVLHAGVAEAIGSARRMALPFAGARSEAWWSSEDR